MEELTHGLLPVSLNPGVALPEERILLALAAEDSSMVLFSQALARVNPQIAALNSQANSSIYALLGSPNINLTTCTSHRLYVRLMSRKETRLIPFPCSQLSCRL